MLKRKKITQEEYDRLRAKTIDSLSIPEIQTKTTPVIVLDSDSELEQQLQEEYQFELLDKLY